MAVHITCPYCGKPLYRSIPNGTTKCGICGKTIKIVNGKGQKVK